MPSCDVTYRCIPLHTVAYRCIPLHTVTYRYLPLHNGMHLKVGEDAAVVEGGVGRGEGGDQSRRLRVVAGGVVGPHAGGAAPTAENPRDADGLLEVFLA